jgi:choline dehydrogenase-like flavoprotein
MFDAFKATTHFQEDVHPEDQTPVNETSFGDGPLEITMQRFQLGFDRPYVDKLSSALGLEEIDFCSGYGIGIAEQVDAIRADNRTRSYAWNTFGWLAVTRPNFEVRHDAWVSKIVFEDKTAVGVTYTDTLSNTTLSLSGREIVVAAGAIGSPHLLMLSGVGPADQLEAVGVDVVHDSPEVGQNLMDHHYARLVYETIPEMGTVWQWQNNISVSEAAEAQYEATGDGLLGVPDGNVFGALRLPDSVFEGLGTYHTSLDADRPHFIYEYSTAPLQVSLANYSTITPFAALVQPEARGNVTLASADYRIQPTINSAYWATEADKAAMIYAYKDFRALMTSPELSPWLPVELFPGANVTSDEDIWAAIQESSGSFHHPMGTVAIGTVLDENWRVRGVDGLRVVGTPAAPRIITCHTQATAYAMGYRAAMDIAAEDGLQIAK